MAAGAETWCIFDNTAAFAAAGQHCGPGTPAGQRLTGRGGPFEAPPLFPSVNEEQRDRSRIPVHDSLLGLLAIAEYQEPGQARRIAARRHGAEQPPDQVPQQGSRAEGAGLGGLWAMRALAASAASSAAAWAS